MSYRPPSDAKRCTAKSRRTHERCGAYASPGTTVCISHGGKSPNGIHGTSARTGRYSFLLPQRLLERYNEALENPELLSLYDEIALVDSKLGETLRGVPTGDVWKEAEVVGLKLLAEHDSPVVRELIELISTGRTEAKRWTQIMTLIDQRRRLVDTERRRVFDEHNALTLERVMVLVLALVDVVRRNVSDLETQHTIGRELRRILGGDARVRTASGVQMLGAEPT